MNTNCEKCGYLFDKESGYFLGAFYVSYAMTVVELLLVYLGLHFIVGNVWVIISFMTTTLILLSFFNFRVSRLIWIHIFNK